MLQAASAFNGHKRKTRGRDAPEVKADAASPIPAGAPQETPIRRKIDTESLFPRRSRSCTPRDWQQPQYSEMLDEIKAIWDAHQTEVRRDTMMVGDMAFRK